MGDNTQMVYTPDVANRICDLIVQGMTIRKIVELPGMPSNGTVFNWLHRQPEFMEQYARARETSAHAFAERVAEIGEDVYAGGSLTPDAARVAIDAAKWTAGRRLPKVYGDKLQTDTTVHAGSGLAAALALMAKVDVYPSDRGNDGSSQS